MSKKDHRLAAASQLNILGRVLSDSFDIVGLRNDNLKILEQVFKKNGIEAAYNIWKKNIKK